MSGKTSKTNKEILDAFGISMAKMSTTLGFCDGYISNYLTDHLSGVSNDRIDEITNYFVVLKDYIDAEETKIYEERKQKRQQALDYIIKFGEERKGARRGYRKPRHPERDSEIYAKYQDGIDVAELSDYYKISKSGIYYILDSVRKRRVKSLKDEELNNG